MKDSPDGISAQLALLLELAGPKAFAAGMKLAQKRVEFTPELVSLIILRLANRDWVPEHGEEAILRDLDPKSLRRRKNANALPENLEG